MNNRLIFNGNKKKYNLFDNNACQYEIFAYFCNPILKKAIFLDLYKGLRFGSSAG
jgi:hypothetical protein